MDEDVRPSLIKQVDATHSGSRGIGKNKVIVKLTPNREEIERLGEAIVQEIEDEQIEVPELPEEVEAGEENSYDSEETPTATVSSRARNDDVISSTSQPNAEINTDNVDNVFDDEITLRQMMEQQRIQVLKDELNTQKEACILLSASLEMSKKKAEGYLVEIEKEKAEKVEMQEEIERLKNDLEEEENKRNEVEARLQQSLLENDELKLQINNLKNLQENTLYRDLHYLVDNIAQQNQNQNKDVSQNVTTDEAIVPTHEEGVLCVANEEDHHQNQALVQPTTDANMLDAHEQEGAQTNDNAEKEFETEVTTEGPRVATNEEVVRNVANTDEENQNQDVVQSTTDQSIVQENEQQAVQTDKNANEQMESEQIRTYKRSRTSHEEDGGQDDVNEAEKRRKKEHRNMTSLMEKL